MVANSAAALAVTLVMAAAVPCQAGDLGVIRVEPILLEPGLKFDEVSHFLNRNGRFLVADGERHQLVFLDAGDLSQVSKLGRIGQGPGEFFGIGDLVIDRDSRIYTLDNAKKRVQYFDWDGKHLGQFLVAPRPFGMAVNSRREVLLGQPQKGKLVSVYSLEGELLRQFGDLRKLSDFYGPDVSDLDEQYAHAINRVNIAVDKDDNVYLTFVGSPFFHKYSSDGSLIFERKVEDKRADEVIREFQRKKKAPMRRGLGDASAATPGISHGIAVDRQAGLVYIPLTWLQGWVYVADSQGNRVASLVYDKQLTLKNISLSEDGSALLGAHFSIVHHDEMYKLNIPKTILDSRKGEEVRSQGEKQ